MLNPKTELIGVSRNIAQIRKLIGKVADTDLNAIIIGETGVGKEVVAKKLYEKSNRFGKPFVKINCASLPENLFKSEMFGHEPEAFTGAHRTMLGKFEQANQGVLFLDEIGDMPMSLMHRLFPALQKGDFCKLGLEMPRKGNTWRIIATTNKDHEKAKAKGRFREDLYHWLRTITIHIDPLRKRPEDIPLLINFYVKKFSTLFSQTKIHPLSTLVIEALLKHRWPGNVRQLQNMLKRLILLGETEEILEEIRDSSVVNQF